MTTPTMTLAKDIPWEITAGVCDTDWQSKWPEMRVKDIDPVEVVADLYLPEGLSCHGFVDVSGIDPIEFEPAMILAGSRVRELASVLYIDSSEVPKWLHAKSQLLKNETPLQKMGRIAKEAKQFQAELIESVIPTFRAYAHAACGGELRHHGAIGGVSLPSVRKGAWTGWKDVFDKHGLPALELMSKLFREMKGSSIGGERWAIASDIIYKYETGQLGNTAASNNKIFLDRVLALQHNGGCFLSKRTWANHRATKDGKIGNTYVSTITTSHQSMVTVLDCHASDPPNVMGLLACASQKVEEMTMEYFNAVEEAGLSKTVEFTVLKHPVSGAAVIMPSKNNSSPVPLIDVLASPGLSTKNQTWTHTSPITTADQIVSTGKFNLEIKIVELKDVNGNSIGSNDSTIAIVPKKVYSFGKYSYPQGSSHDVATHCINEFNAKSFHFSHMIKTQYPGARATSILIRITNGSSKSKYVRINNSFGFTKMSGQALLAHANNI